MGLTGTLYRISLQVCQFCKQEVRDHSKKDFMRCLTTAHADLKDAMMETQELKKFIDDKIKESEEAMKAQEVKSETNEK